MASSAETPDERPLYSISVAAELAGLPLPTLRLYEQRGLVAPARTSGGTRRYSDADVERIRRIATLVDSGVTLAAAGMVLDLQDDNADLATRNEALRARNSSLREDNARLKKEASGSRD